MAEQNLVVPLIDVRRCIGCGSCAERCPTKAVEVRGSLATIVYPQRCTFCELCETNCPTEAIQRPFTVVFAPAPPAPRQENVKE